MASTQRLRKRYERQRQASLRTRGKIIARVRNEQVVTSRWTRFRTWLGTP